MGKEIERKFVIKGDGWRDHVSSGVRVEQAYLPPSWLKLTDQEGVGHLWLDSPEILQSGPAFAYLVDRDDVDALREVCKSEYSVRIRLKYGKTKKASLTIKSANPGTTRDEFNYEIPVKDVQRIFDESLYQGSIIDKVRYEIPYDGLTIELDQFFGDNEGLVMAEVELPDENTVFNPPGWFGPEVTKEPCFYNERLRTNPAKNWLQDWLNAH